MKCSVSLHVRKLLGEKKLPLQSTYLLEPIWYHKTLYSNTPSRLPSVEKLPVEKINR